MRGLRQAAGSRALAGAGVLCLLAGCGSSAATHSASGKQWTALRRVTVTVRRPLPPPAGGPFTTSFTNPGELTRVATALNADHIAQEPISTTNPGCAGGAEITITIVPQHGFPAHLAAYQCANHTSGDVAGNLTGFLSAVGVSA